MFSEIRAGAYHSGGGPGAGDHMGVTGTVPRCQSSGVALTVDDPFGGDVVVAVDFLLDVGDEVVDICQGLLDAEEREVGGNMFAIEVGVRLAIEAVFKNHHSGLQALCNYVGEEAFRVYTVAEVLPT